MGDLRQSQTKKRVANQERLASSSNKPHTHSVEELQGIFGYRGVGQLLQSLGVAPRQVMVSPELLLRNVSPDRVHAYFYPSVRQSKLAN